MQVLATINLDVPAHSQEEAAALAKAVTLSPVEPLFVEHLGHECGIAVWACSENSVPECVDVREISDIPQLIQAYKELGELAAMNGNTEELTLEIHRGTQ